MEGTEPINSQMPVNSQMLGWMLSNYRKVPKFLDARKLCCNLTKTRTKRPNFSVFRNKDANGIVNSEDPGQTAPLGAV